MNSGSHVGAALRRPGFALFAILAASLCSAQDWPQWRGPNRDGLVLGFREPKAWPQSLKRLWKVEMGAGYSSPVVSAGKIYLLTRKEDREVVSCLRMDTGQVAWQQSYPAPYQMNPAATSHGKWPKSTPAVHQGRLCTLGISGILSCFDAATGKLLWRKDFSGEFKETSPWYGAAMSPLMDQGLLIAHVGGHDNGGLTAFAPDTGQMKWRWKGDGPGYASPVLMEMDGTRQVVTQTQQSLVGVSEATGELLWKIPFTTEYVQNAVTPVVDKQVVFYSGINKGTTAIRVVHRGKEWATEKAWENADISMYLSSPVASGDYLFGLSHKRRGQFFCLDARTGATLWTSNGREGDNAAIVQGGEWLFLLNNDAQLIVARKNPKAFEPVQRYTAADSPTWAHPVIVGQQILIKDASTLALWSWE